MLTNLSVHETGVQLPHNQAPHNQGGPGCVARRSLATLEVRSLIPGAGNNNVLVTESDWPTLVSSVCYASLGSASADRDLKPGSK